MREIFSFIILVFILVCCQKEPDRTGCRSCSEEIIQINLYTGDSLWQQKPDIGDRWIECDPKILKKVDGEIYSLKNDSIIVIYIINCERLKL